MEAGNQLCKECGLNEAEVFCICTSPESCFCKGCFFKHSSQFSRVGHTTWPMQYLACYKNPHFFDRKEAFTKVCAQALANVTSVDRAITQLQDMQALFAAYFEDKLKQMRSIEQQLRREIQEAVAEVERTLPEEHPRLYTVYGPVLRHLVEIPQPFQILEFTLPSVSPADLISLHIHLKGPDEMVGVKQYPAVWGNMLSLYDLSTRNISQVSLSVTFTDGTSYIDIDHSTLLCLGGYPSCTDVYALHLHSAQLNTCPALTDSRCATGAVRWGNCVYAMGGIDRAGGLMSSCEKWQTNAERWTEIAPMRYPRAYFTPCRHESLLYLLSTKSKDHRAIETFNPATETFSLLAVSLPPQLKLSAASVSFVCDGELCLLTHKKQLVRWQVNGTELRLSEVQKRCWATQLPIVLGNEVLIAYMGRVMTLSLESYTFLSY